VRTLVGEVPDPANPPSGCHFHPRCPLAEEVCLEVTPALALLAPDHMAACHVAARRAGRPEATMDREKKSRCRLVRLNLRASEA